MTRNIVLFYDIFYIITWKKGGGGVMYKIIFLVQLLVFMY